MADASETDQQEEQSQDQDQDQEQEVPERTSLLAIARSVPREWVGRWIGPTTPFSRNTGLSLNWLTPAELPDQAPVPPPLALLLDPEAWASDSPTQTWILNNLPRTPRLLLHPRSEGQELDDASAAALEGLDSQGPAELVDFGGPEDLRVLPAMLAVVLRGLQARRLAAAPLPVALATLQATSQRSWNASLRRWLAKAMHVVRSMLGQL